MKTIKQSVERLVSLRSGWLAGAAMALITLCFGCAQPNHMVDWLNCIRTRGTPKCSTDETFIETATFLMSLTAQQEKRLVRWDAIREEMI